MLTRNACHRSRSSAELRGVHQHLWVALQRVVRVTSIYSWVLPRIADLQVIGTRRSVFISSWRTNHGDAPPPLFANSLTRS